MPAAVALLPLSSNSTPTQLDQPEARLFAERGRRHARRKSRSREESPPWRKRHCDCLHRARRPCGCRLVLPRRRWRSARRASSRAGSWVPTERRSRRFSSSCATTSPDSRPTPRPAATARFHFFNVPFNPYELHVEVQGFAPVHKTLDVRTSHSPRRRDQARSSGRGRVGQRDGRTDGGAARNRQHDLAHRHRQVVHPAGSGGGAHARDGGDRDVDARLRARRERPLPLPGRAQPERVRHRRADDRGPDGRDVLELDRPGIAQSIEVIYGNVPAEFGEKVGAVINMTTKSGLGSPFKGNVIGSFATFDTYQGGFSMGGGTQEFGVFASVNAAGSNYFTDAPNPDNLHNDGNTQRAFVRLDSASPGFGQRISAVGAARPDGSRRSQPLLAGGRGPGRSRRDLRPELQPRVAEHHVGLDRSRRDGLRAPGAVHALSVGRRHADHGRLEPLAEQLRHHPFLLVDDRHSRDQGGRRLQGIPDEGALPLRNHRSRRSTTPRRPTTTRTSRRTT